MGLSYVLNEWLKVPLIGVDIAKKDNPAVLPKGWLFQMTGMSLSHDHDVERDSSGGKK